MYRHICFKMTEEHIKAMKGFMKRNHFMSKSELIRFAVIDMLFYAKETEKLPVLLTARDLVHGKRMVNTQLQIPLGLLGEIDAVAGITNNTRSNVLRTSVVYFLERFAKKLV